MMTGPCSSIFESVTAWPPVSVSVKSGARSPTLMVAAPSSAARSGMAMRSSSLPRLLAAGAACRHRDGPLSRDPFEVRPHRKRPAGGAFVKETDPADVQWVDNCAHPEVFHETTARIPPRRGARAGLRD